MVHLIVVRWPPSLLRSLIKSLSLKHVCDSKSIWDFKWLLFVNKTVTFLKEFCELGELTKAINFVLQSSASTVLVCTLC